MTGEAGTADAERRSRRLRRPAVALAAVVVIAAGIQLVPVDRTNPPVTSRPLVDDEVGAILRRACYDCHSNETRWPWYSRVAPVSWFVVRHVEEGRGQLNFSQWPAFDFAKQDHLLREIAEEVEEGSMPLASYVWGHPDARLGEEDRRLLLEWARGD